MGIQKRNLRTDKQGVSGWAILLIILISLLAWEIGGQYAGITTPSSFLTTTPDEVTAKCYLVNDISGVKIPMTPKPTAGSPGDHYNTYPSQDNTGWHFLIVTNAPYTFFGDKWTIQWETWHSENGYTPVLVVYDTAFTKIGYTALFTDKFNLDTSIFTTDITDLWIGEIWMYSPDGHLSFNWSMGINVP